MTWNSTHHPPCRNLYLILSYLLKLLIIGSGRYEDTCCPFQIEFDKTAEEFRKAHADRQELINQWEYTIDQMQRRDKEMDLLAAVSWYFFVMLNLI